MFHAVGDRQFVAFMVDMYGPDASGHRKMFRINHSSDIVPKVRPCPNEWMTVH